MNQQTTEALAQRPPHGGPCPLEIDRLARREADRATARNSQQKARVTVGGDEGFCDAVRLVGVRATARIRTEDLCFTKASLCQLSYGGGSSRGRDSGRVYSRRIWRGEAELRPLECDDSSSFSLFGLRAFAEHQGERERTAKAFPPQWIAAMNRRTPTARSTTRH